MPKTCNYCGKVLSIRNSFEFDGKPTCRGCLGKLEEGGALAASMIQTITSDKHRAISRSFETLRLIAMIYVVVSLVGAVLILFGAGSLGSLVGMIAALGIAVQGFAGGLVLWVISRMAEYLWDIRQVVNSLRDQE